MYKVTIINGDAETVIHSPHANGLKLETGTIKKEVNKIDSFNMSFFLNNPAYGKLKPFKTLINVLNTKTLEYEFEGRILNPNGSMDDDGLHVYNYECEGELGYLHDSQQKHLEFRGTPKELVTLMLNYHNSQVEDYKHFEVGNIEVTTSTDNLYVYLSAESTTFEEIDDKILGRVGGELRIRKENGVRYLDVLERVGEDKQTEIRIAKNLRSISQSVDPTEIITRLTPLGTRIESEDEGATDASEARLTIESVNNGLPYIDRPDLIAEFGIQGGSITWDDITLPNRLLTTGQNWINKQKIALYQYEISALDLFLIGLDMDNFDVGNSHPVINPIMGIDELLRIIGKTTDINNPQDASLKFGDKFKTLNDYQADSNKSARKVVELESIVNTQSSRIGGLLQQINNVNTEIGNVKNIIIDADLEELPNAISALEQAINNLNDALDGIPIYDLATPTSDGLMASADKVKLDGLQNYSLATEFTNGLMTMTDKQKLNRITVTGNIDLDDLLARLVVLETQ
ncbi:lysin [Oceanobacillus arenosus]|uniref:Lysin n=1 Tax=Oceanobacillus arenosus TaxID=1229153 RepID=A0A3D8PY17_9BACI|nr:phage tail spike protein [Oceanobacillus arenosus]RDW21046.1 lysin [Oceanobacillus arenosus]